MSSSRIEPSWTQSGGAASQGSGASSSLGTWSSSSSLGASSSSPVSSTTSGSTYRRSSSSNHSPGMCSARSGAISEGATSGATAQADTIKRAGKDNKERDISASPGTGKVLLMPRSPQGRGTSRPCGAATFFCPDQFGSTGHDLLYSVAARIREHRPPRARRGLRRARQSSPPDRSGQGRSRAARAWPGSQRGGGGGRGNDRSEHFGCLRPRSKRPRPQRNGSSPILVQLSC